MFCRRESEMQSGAVRLLMAGEARIEKGSRGLVFWSGEGRRVVVLSSEIFARRGLPLTAAVLLMLIDAVCWPSASFLGGV